MVRTTMGAVAPPKTPAELAGIKDSHLLLGALWRSPDLFHQLWTQGVPTKRFGHIQVPGVSMAITRAMSMSAYKMDAYFALGEFKTPDNRKAVNVVGVFAFWMDIDCGDEKAAAGKGYKTEDDALAAVQEFCKRAGLPMPTFIVSSGGGLHVYWVMDSFITREIWQPSATKLKALTHALGFLADDSRTSDIASVLRLPGTNNYKYDPPRMVTLRQASADYIEQPLMLAAIDAAHNLLCSVATPKQSEIVPFPLETQSEIIARLEALLKYIDPNCNYQDWCNVLMAIHHATGGSEGGFELADQWSAPAKSYPGSREIRNKWLSFKGGGERPITIGTLIKMARENGMEAFDDPEEFKPCETEVVEPAPLDVPMTKPEKAEVVINPLAKFSLIDSVESLEKQMVDETLILGEIVLKGQGTALFGSPNSGKTLVTFALIIQGIKNGRIDPAKLFYLNMDDSSHGLAVKGRIASEYGFHMIADGHRGFEAKEFRVAMEWMISTDTASGVIVVIDTLKKFCDIMNKTMSSNFAKVIRKFVLKGGTVVALSHVNKNPALDGSVRYAGTSDIVDDLDCAYTVKIISQGTDTGVKVVEFTKIKGRGSVAFTAGYSYAQERGITYDELLLSVKAVDAAQLEPLKLAEQTLSDASVIEAVKACISEGITTKMKLADAASERVKCSKRHALTVINKYTGDDPVNHRWRYMVGDRGAKVYELLPGREPEPQ